MISLPRSLSLLSTFSFTFYLSLSDSSVFSLVNSDGEAITTENTGLLLMNGGTVCAHGFGQTTADYVMAIMGFSGM